MAWRLEDAFHCTCGQSEIDELHYASGSTDAQHAVRTAMLVARDAMLRAELDLIAHEAGNAYLTKARRELSKLLVE